MMRVAIIADDLTGASDSGVQLARRGADVTVCLNVDGLSDARAATAVVLDTDSRAVPATEAYSRVQEATLKLREAGFSPLYKKLDSTLRGNVGAELDAMMDAEGYRLALVAPAFPRTGRTTVHGVHLLHGVPVSRTHIAQDLISPVLESSIVLLLQAQSRRRSGLVALPTVRAGPKVIQDQLTTLRAEGVEIIVLDAETDDDLCTIAAAARACGPDALCAGSAGLADALAGTWELGPPQSARKAALLGDRPVLLVSGSTSEVTREQVRRCIARPGTVHVELDSARISEDASRTREIERCKAEVEAALSRNTDVVLSLREYNARGSIEDVLSPQRLVDALGQAAAGAVRSHQPGGIVLTGGDTARAVCGHLGVAGIRLLYELEPGVPLGELEAAGGPLVITKAGAFGTPKTLVNAMEALRHPGYHTQTRTGGTT